MSTPRDALGRPSIDTAEAHAVVRELVRAENALSVAETVTNDRGVRDAIREARRPLRGATERARRIYGDERLRHARQPEIPFSGPEE